MSSVYKRNVEVFKLICRDETPSWVTKLILEHPERDFLQACTELSHNILLGNTSGGDVSVSLPFFLHFKFPIQILSLLESSSAYVWFEKADSG